MSLCNNSIACFNRVNFNYFYLETISVSFLERYLCRKHYFIWAVACLKMSLSIRFIVIVIKDSNMRDIVELYFITIVNKEGPRMSTLASQVSSTIVKKSVFFILLIYFWFLYYNSQDLNVSGTWCTLHANKSKLNQCLQIKIAELMEIPINIKN